ncbi:MFS transporter [Terrihabitans sp. B22-R8]|uniref:MFS transporter n=1 Tax=Terrihabitans sp. B22-R8 TaxID=3425128 RepID=UPI00403D38EE
MPGSLRSASVLLAAAFLINAASGALLSLLALRLSAIAPPLVVGLVSAAYFAGLVAGALLAFHVVVRAGHIRAFASFATLSSASVLVYPMSDVVALWGGLRFIEGFCMAGLFICMESWLNDHATPATRGRLLAFYMSALYLGQALGQSVLNIPDPTGFVACIVISVLFSMAVLPVALTRMAPPPLPDVASMSLKRLYGVSPLGVIGAIGSGLVLGSLFTLGPVFAAAEGVDVPGTALFMGVAILGGVALQWPVGRLSDRLERRRVIAGVLVAIALASGAMLFSMPFGFFVLLATAALFGGAAFVLYPLCVALTNDYLARDQRVAASGGLVLAYSSGATFGPILSSGLMSGMGAGGLFVFTGLVALLVLGFGLWRIRVAAGVPVERQSTLQVQAPTTPAGVPLHVEERHAPPARQTVETVPEPAV